MKTLFLYLLIAVGVAGILHCRVNLGMSWVQMSAAIENLLPRLMSIVIVLLGLVVTLAYVTSRRPPE